MAGSKPRKGQRKCAGSSGGRESGAAALAMVQVGSGALAVGGGGGTKRGVQEPPRRDTAGARVLLCYGTSQDSAGLGWCWAQRQGEAGPAERRVSGEEGSLKPQMALPGSA